MYSVVLLMAMTSGGDLPSGHHHGGCCGGYTSCCGGYSYGCCGGYSYGCCGGYSSYSGCCGGYSYGCGGGGHHHHHSSYGCCGGYSYGCCGGYSYGCCGGYSSYSGCTGYVDSGCGCEVSYPGCTGGVVTGTGDNGGNATAGTTDDNKTTPLTADEQKELNELKKANPDKADDIEKFFKEQSHEGRKDLYEKQKPGKTDDKKTDDKGKAMVPAPATIIVSLPADAKLTIDDAATRSTSTPRVFSSPVLPTGRDFHYTLKAEMVRDGKSVQLSKEVTVRAGQETRVNLEAGLSGVASR